MEDVEGAHLAVLHQDPVEDRVVLAHPLLDHRHLDERRVHRIPAARLDQAVVLQEDMEAVHTTEEVQRNHIDQEVALVEA